MNKKGNNGVSVGVKPVAELYTTPTCKYCGDVKRFFDLYKVKYITYDVSKDPEARVRLMDDLGERGVPVTVVNGKKVVGFKEAELKELLNIK
jgi:glutaredoxin 3